MGVYVSEQKNIGDIIVWYLNPVYWDCIGNCIVSGSIKWRNG